MVVNGIRNDEGKIALKWAITRRQAPPHVRIDGTDRTYSPAYQNNIAMIWVVDEDVDRLLDVKQKTCNCNNGTFQNAFVIASTLDVNLWRYNNREGIPT